MGAARGGGGVISFGQDGRTMIRKSEDNVLIALVNWVEHGSAPRTLIGVKFEDNDLT